ncbi:hypothetical protein JOE57_003150 [Microlunatus panaciterrae]|uniref:Membrane proteinase PrsW, cleaves anti-sigma factor RsiW, M82 family n=1 Tax=Microlunatus panaciterrae TaxID=400768 RepID=A0ABS2RMJ7_9ACTN|nr:PrsW family glutamic-type intramembrane protease [Microlunatus panaciterrae]MBM7800229.1 hypothetical protein [Microlunatus panaciterrae]
MPRGVGQRPQTYRVALVIALTVALLAAIFGAMPIAVLVAAFAIPVVYIVYIYDVNLWEDEPIPVTALAFVLTGALTIAFTIVWRMLAGNAVPITGLGGETISAPTIGGFLIMALLVPIIGEAIKQVGPIILASRPEFDDLMDGLTFGVISGVAYATFDTLVKHWDLLTGGLVAQDPGQWVSLIFLEGFVKPLLFGTATGIACAEYSGLGKGYDGFTPRYYRGLAEAIVANIAYQAGAYLFSFVSNSATGIFLSILWGIIILGILILRIRNVLHVGLMEAALERSARQGGLGAAGELQFCAQCEMPLLEHAAFCNACGTAVRVTPKSHRVKVLAATGAGPAGAHAAGTAGAAEDTLAQQPPPTVGSEQPSTPTAQPHTAAEDTAQDTFRNDEEGRA